MRQTFIERSRELRSCRLPLQGVVVAIVCAVIALVAAQTVTNLRARGIASGFAYLSRPAGFEITEGVVPYSSRDSYAGALEVGLVNTLRVAALGILIATALGLVIGVARLSPVWIASTASALYVEALRNTPLLLQLLFWYSLFQALPDVRAAWHPLPGVSLSNRGLIVGGISTSPEFAALLIGLSTCTAAFIGEIVRGGILSVGRGQTEAAAALGLSRGQALRLVVLPQALAVIVPPTTSQYLNLAKNSSLAVAIGYPELISVTDSTLNQTGQAIEAITVAMLVYLAISLTFSLAIHLWRRERR